MNRRDLIKSVSAIGLVAAIPAIGQSADGDSEPNDDHICDSTCFAGAEVLARAIIEETGSWKLTLHDWTKRVMVVTRHGQSACEIALANLPHHPYWVFKQRLLTREETRSFRTEYGRSASLLLGVSESPKIRGFILNGRNDGWNLSIETDHFPFNPKR